MASFNPTDILQNIAQGSFKQVVEENNRFILIETNTIKIKNKVLRQFVDRARKDGFQDKDIISILLRMDEAVENNQVRKTIKEYLK